MNRNKTIQTIREMNDVSVLIIGGGINGVGTFRDLALQGVNVLLVERGDFASGASSASSHMVHGGIRYLENGEFRLVREAVQERNRLIENAPQYVNPLATTIPIFKWGSGIFNAPLKFLNLLDRPAERGALVIKAGLTMYDAYTSGGAVPKHDFVLREKSLAAYPALNPEIVCTATYYDAAMPSPERILVEVLRDGVAEGDHAQAVNYVSAVGLKNGAVVLRDELTQELFEIRPKLLINAAGPWIDFVNDTLDQPSRFIGGTKGSHIVLDNPELRAALCDHEFFFENEDGRIVLIYPLKDKVMLGTSDIAITDPSQVRCTEDEIDYFFELVDRIFPSIEVSREQIVHRFSGVRPLPASDAKTTGQVTRDHHNQIVPADAQRPFATFNLIGGKWTTFRAFGEQTADKALDYLAAERIASTVNLSIGGGYTFRDANERTAWIANVVSETAMDEKFITTWLDRYGTRALEIAQFAADQATPDAPLAHNPKYTRHEIAYLAHT
ncbi:MAG TPA: glycerol-3-phosphate dehydrogenase/oxidase, partial [Anaerolineae bacterium]|nr:glycerol-3-phosphate dehydrogenase/oxidase [Anaerolineae bacterium]